VLRVWIDEVRHQVPRAEGVSHPVLTDTMPVLYERMAAMLTPAHFSRDGIDISSIAAEHGVERANLTDFQAETILAEFQIFRGVLFDMLDAHDVALTGPERRALHLTIDMAVRESVRAFVAAGDQLRERVAGALAHDLRQPVTNMLLATDLMLQLDPPPAIADWTRRIAKNGERIAIMLGELLDALSVQAGGRLKLALDQFDLYALAHNVAERAHDYQGADVRLSGMSVTGWWNRSALERALENLVGNAHKYGDPGAPIEVHVGESNGCAILSVRNQGKPIPPENSRRSSSSSCGRRTREKRRRAAGAWACRMSAPWPRAMAAVPSCTAMRGRGPCS